MRKIILYAAGVLIVAASIFLGNYLIKINQKPKPKFKKDKKTVFVTTVENGETPVLITTNGSLVAKNKIEIYSEVQGVLQPTAKLFKAGTVYTKGETLLKIDNEEFYASLQAQKSNFVNLITAILPDIKLDFSAQFDKWNNYVSNIDINKPLPNLPQFSTDKEKYFVTGKNIVTTYYNIKNLEVRLSKYVVRAPFSGILTEALVTNGTLVRTGQKLGEYIDTSVFEIEIALSAQYANFLKVGNTIELTTLDNSKTYLGKITRVNGKIDATSQTINAFAQVTGGDLKEGMFLQARLNGNPEPNSFQVDRKLLINNNALYIVESDSILTLKTINPVFFSSDKVIVKGLEDNTLVVTQPIPGAFEGMIVNTNKK